MLERDEIIGVGQLARLLLVIKKYQKDVVFFLMVSIK